MTDIENDYTPDPREAREFKKVSTTMLKGFAGQANFQQKNANISDDVADAMATSPEVVALAKQAWLESDMDTEATYWKLAYAFRKSGVSLPKIDDTTRTAIGSVTGGQVPKKKLPSEVEEGLGNMENYANRLSPGQPEAQVSTQRVYSGPSNSQGWTDQNQTGGSDLNQRNTTSYTAPIGRTSTPSGPNLRSIAGTNPSYSTGRGDQGQVGSPGQSGQYSDERARLAYSSISQKPGDARTTYKYLGKPGSEKALENRPPEKVETVTKFRHMNAPQIEADDTYLVKHMISAAFQGSPDDPTPINQESIGQSMRQEDEAREMEAQPRLEASRREEDELDEATQNTAQKLESDADELVAKARQFELAGDWKNRDEYLYLSKLKRGQAFGLMRSIAKRHGNANLPTGM